MGRRSRFPEAFARNRALWALGALIALLMLPNFVWLWYSHGIITWVCALIVPAILLLTLFSALGNHLWIACFLLTPFAILAPLETYYIASYFRPTSVEVLATVFATNVQETIEYLGDEIFPLCLCLAAATSIALLASWWSLQMRLRWSHASRAWVLASAIAAPFTVVAVASGISAGGLSQRFGNALQMVTALTDAIESGYPFGLVARIADYRREWTKMRNEAARLDSFRFGATRAQVPAEHQAYVLVIGESSRRDHWQLFGYSRPTNPELMHVKNLVPIDNMMSSWSASAMAIPMIVTRKPASSHSINWPEPSIVRAMQEAGFETFWISNQMAIGKDDSPTSIFSMQAGRVRFLNHASWISAGNYDGKLVGALTDALENSHKDVFIVLHMMGSHERYDNRYPREFAIFGPTLADGASNVASRDRRQNSYDNSILYSDHVLGAIIRVLQKRSGISALWFESDHGEDLPTATCSLLGHGNSTPYDFEIPAFFWFSDAYASTYPERVASLGENAGKLTTSAVTFESLIDMAGIDFPGHDKTMSLFSPLWHPITRMVNGLWEVDIDRAVLSKPCGLALPPD